MIILAVSLILPYSTWAVEQYTVNFVEGANGSITGTKVQLVDLGSACTEVTAVPSPGYYFDSWTGDYTGTGNPLTIANVTSNMTITANFSIILFTDVTAARFPAVSESLGNSFFDIDNDGDLDLADTRASFGGDFVYINNGAGTFTKASGNAGVTFSEGHSVIPGDFDNDGYMDFAIGWYWVGGSQVYRNNGNNTFSNVSSSCGVGNPGNVWSGAFGDIDADGDLDLVLAVNGSNRLYVNNGTGHFSNEASARGAATGGNSTASYFIDYDNDGDIDLIVVSGIITLLRNDGTGHFTDVTAASGITSTAASACFGDMDNDGDLDFFSSGSSGLFINNGNGTFTSIAGTCDITPGGGPQAMFADVNNDGYLDLLETGKLWINNGDLTFTERTSVNGIGSVGNVDSAIFGDIDGDGDLDLRTTSKLFVNNTNNSNYLIVCPTERYGSPAFNAKVWIYEAGHIGDPGYLLGYREVIGGAVRHSGSMPNAHFGLPNNAAVDVRVRFLSGAVTDTLNVARGQRTTINPVYLTTTSSPADKGSTAPALPVLVAPNVPQAISATPIQNYHFTNWTAAPSGSAVFGDPNSADTNVTLSAMCTVTANFAIDTRTVTFVEGSGGTITGSKAQTVDYGGNCTAVTGVPDGGYYFTGWTGAYIGIDNPLTIMNVTADKTITANFAPRLDNVVIFLAGANGSLTGTQIQTVNDGGSCNEVTAVPATGYHFTGWSGDYVGNENPLALDNVTSDMDITANFAINQYTVTFVEGANGTIAGTKVQIVDHGGSCSAVSAVPNTAYGFLKWTGDYSGTANPMTISNVTSNMTITANFAIILFTDVTAAKFPSVSVSSGNTFFDIDNDGDLDLADTRASYGGDFVYLNNGAGTFTKAPGNAGVTALEGHSIIPGDFNNDGFMDFAIGWYWSGGSKVYLNNGDGTFTDVSSSCGVGNPGNIWGGAFGDIDADGDLELIFSVNGTNRLYVNNGSGHFSEQAAARGAATGQNTECTYFVDYDHDGDIDIFTTKDEDGAAILNNNGSGYFSDVTGSTGIAPYKTRCGAFGDVDNDGDQDFIQTESTLSLNDGSGFFTSISGTCGIVLTGYPKHIICGDVNNDGYLDVFADAQMWINNGDLTFSNQTTVCGLDGVGSVEGVTFGDIDGDGDLDLRTSSRLYVNNTNNNNYLIVCPLERYGTPALNAKVWVYEAGHIGESDHLLGYREIIGGTVRISGSTPYAHFGLPDDATVDVRVRFLNGAVTDTLDVARGQKTNVYPVYLTMASSPVDKGSTTPAAPVLIAPNVPQAISATPVQNYHFSGWTADPAGNAVFGDSNSANTNVTLSAMCTATANFAIDTRTVTFVEGSGGTITGSKAQTVDYGCNCTAVTAVPDVGYYFTGWTGAYIGIDNPLTITNVTADKTITANFAPRLDNVVIFLAGANGSLTGTQIQTVNDGGSCNEVTAVPATGYHFTGWSGDYVGNENPLVLSNATTDMDITANFAINQYTVTFVEGPNGSITGNEIQTVSYGGNCTAVTAVPNSWHLFAGWTGDYSGLGNPLTITNVTSDMVVAANFMSDNTLVGYYPFNGNADDESGRSNNGTVSGPALANDRFGNANSAYHFDGIDDYINLHDPISGDFDFGLNDSFTLSAWFKTSAPASSEIDLFIKRRMVGGVFDEGYRLKITPQNKIGFELEDTNNTYPQIFSPAAVNDGKWHQLTAVRNTSQDKLLLYIDGIQVATPVTDTTTTSLATTVDLLIGKNPYSGYSYFFNGELDDLRIYRRALTDTEISELYDIDYLTMAVFPAPGGTALPSGATSIRKGTATAITATPSIGYHFVNWTASPADKAVFGNANNASATVTLSAACTVTATFALNTYTATFIEGANGTITGGKTQIVAHGGNCTAVTAVPNAGYHFTGWTGDYVGLVNPLTVTNVISNMTTTANFAINTYTLTYNAGVNGSITGTTPQTVNYGTDGAQVTAVPDAGYHFVKWNDDVMTASRTDTNITSDKTVTASFAINIYTFTYNAGANGSITGTTPQTINHGADGAQVTAVPDANYHFVKWSDDVMIASRTDTNVTGEKTVTANFAINTYTLTYNAGVNGSITGTTPQTVNYGTDGAQVTAVPDAGYHFVNWSDSSTANPRIDASVAGDITVAANFAINTYNVTFDLAGKGIRVGGGALSQVVDYGSGAVAPNVSPNEGWTFAGWDKTFDNVTGDLAVTAIFDGIIIYVKSDATGANDGTSWTNAYTNLQPAIDAAVSGDQVWVAKGSYNPTSWPNGAREYWDQSIRAMHFSLKNGVSVYGGLIGTEIFLTQRDILANPTILSGDIGTAGDNSDNCYSVFCHPEGLNLDSTAIIDGFTISGGNGMVSPTGERYSGGGMYNRSSSPTINNCTFSGNIGGYGGGMHNYTNASPTLYNCTFSRNIANLGVGGGMYNNSGSSPNLTNCTFIDNCAGVWDESGLQCMGGGMFNHYSSPRLTNCTFSGNSTVSSHGYDSFQPTTTGGMGGGICNSESSPVLTNCTFKDNSSKIGGGMYNISYSNPVIANSIFWGNSPSITQIYNKPFNPTRHFHTALSKVDMQVERISSLLIRGCAHWPIIAALQKLAQSLQIALQ